MRLRGGEKVLVRVPSWLGDAVMSEPAIRALHQWQESNSAGGSLTLAGPAALLSLLEGAAPGARLVPLESADRGAFRAWRGHDVALLLTGSFRSAWMAARAGIPERVGWSRDARGFLLTSSMTPARECGRTPLSLGRRGGSRRWLPRYFGSTCNELLAHIGLPVRETRPRLHATAQARALVAGRLQREGLAPGEPFLAINAGGRADSAKAIPTKLWVDALREFGRAAEAVIVIVAGPGEEERAEQLGAALERSIVLSRPVLNLAEELALFEEARVVLTGDTGPRHLAVACGARLVALLGPTDPRHTGDFLTNTRVLRRVVSCGPCHLERCPLGGPDHQTCLTGLDPSAIAAAALELFCLPPSTPAN